MNFLPKWAVSQVEELDDWAIDLPIYAQVVYAAFFVFGFLVSLPIKLFASAVGGLISGVIAGCTWNEGK